MHFARISSIASSSCLCLCRDFKLEGECTIFFNDEYTIGNNAITTKNLMMIMIAVR